MPKICYTPKKFLGSSRAVIQIANQILADYAKQGFDLTLRQLYYQFVAKDLFPDDRKWTQTGSGKWVQDANGKKNAEPNYKWLGDIVNHARLAGLIDWDFIIDRTRGMRQNPHWKTPAEIIESCALQFQIDKWANQDNYVEVWVEKDALVGVVATACGPLDVPYFSCRGYTSQSEMWVTGQRLMRHYRAGKRIRIIHLGDHDPSGCDMSRDIEDRLRLFMDYHVRVDSDRPDDGAPMTLDRIALNMDQIRQYNPPPNPAKLTDARARGYVEEHGDESWELDALEPAVLTNLIREAVLALRDDTRWEKDREHEDRQRSKLAKVAIKFDTLKL